MESTASHERPGMRTIIFTPSSGWRRIRSHSSGVRRAGLRSTSAGTAILPRSCISAATPRSARDWRDRPSTCPMLTARMLTFTQWA